MTKEISMRYVFVLSACDAGGVSIYCRNFAEALVQRGEEVLILLWIDDSSPYSVKHKKVGEIPVAELRYNSLDKCSVSVDDLKRQAKLKDGDVIISQSFPLISDLLQILRKNIKLFHVEVLHDESELFLRFAHQVQSTCDLYVAVNKRIARNLNSNIQVVKEWGVPVAICPGGVVVPEKNPVRDHSTPFRIIYVGRLDPVDKRIFDLLEVAGHLISDNVNFHLHIVGGGVALEELTNRVVDMGAEKYISFKGVCSQENVMQQLNHCHSFILPSAQEAFSLALSEAMAHGLVPVATKVSGAEDAIEDNVNGYLVEIGDTITMAMRLKSLSEDVGKWREMSARAWLEAHENRGILTRLNIFQNAVLEMVASDEKKTKPSFCKHQRILDSQIIPNFITRYIRKSWRKLRGRPLDVAIHGK